MRKIKKGILGGFAGSVGNVVGGLWKGIDYMRTKSSHVKNPNIVGQQAQRLGFKGCVYLAKELVNTMIKPIWNQEAIKMSGYNLFVKLNMDAFNNYGEIEDYSKVDMTAGSLCALELIIEKDSTDKSILNLSWLDNKKCSKSQRRWYPALCYSR